MWVNYLKNPDHKCHKCPADILMLVIITLNQLNNNKVTTNCKYIISPLIL